MSTSRFIEQLNPKPIIITRKKIKPDSTTEHYRLFLSPIDPSAAYSLKNGRMKFIHKIKGFKDHPIAILKYEIKNIFIVKAYLAQNFNKLSEYACNRNESKNQILSDTIVVDINKNFFDKNTDIEQMSYIKPEPDKGFHPPIIYTVEDSNSSQSTKVSAAPLATSIIYSQNINIDLTSREDKSLVFPTTYISTTRNPLTDKEGWLKFKVLTYGSTHGQDILLSAGLPLVSIGFRRTINNLSDWCQHGQALANRKSYLKLTKQIDSSTHNAGKIARLFRDYAKKSRGFSALLHCHLFRHTENIVLADLIAKELSSEVFENASNTDILTYLWQKFSKHCQDYSINSQGSLLRRMNYAFAQLSQGECYSLQEVEDRLKHQHGM